MPCELIRLVFAIGSGSRLNTGPSFCSLLLTWPTLSSLLLCGESPLRFSSTSLKFELSTSELLMSSRNYESLGTSTLPPPTSSFESLELALLSDALEDSLSRSLGDLMIYQPLLSIWITLPWESTFNSSSLESSCTSDCYADSLSPSLTSWIEGRFKGLTVFVAF